MRRPKVGDYVWAHGPSGIDGASNPLVITRVEDRQVEIGGWWAGCRPAKGDDATSEYGLLNYDDWFHYDEFLSAMKGGSDEEK